MRIRIPTKRARLRAARTVSTALAALACIASTSQAAPNPILFVTQVPVGRFGSVTSAFGNHVPTMQAAPRGGDLVLRAADGSLRFLTAEAGYGSSGQQGANAIAVREPCVHWSGAKALFSMVVGAPTQRYQVGTFLWQVYEVTGLGTGETAQIRKIAGQPAYNNVSPVYGTDGRILFVSDRTPTGEPHLYPQRDEYESAPTVAGLWSLDEAAGDLRLLEHAPSGLMSVSLDSFGRVIFTRWDHLQRDQQGDATGVAAAYGAFTWASEAASAAKTTAVAGAEVFPEPRSVNDPGFSSALSLHTFNQFFPWQIEEDGTGEETLNHVGRHELGGTYTDGSFLADPNLTYDVPPSFHANQLEIGGDGGLLHLREDPTHPGEYLATNAPEFGTGSGGVVLRLTGGTPGTNPDAMTLVAVTPTRNDAQVPQATGYFRNPLPLSDGTIVASHTGATGQLADTGTTQAPAWNYAFRLKQLQSNGAFLGAGATLTPGLSKSITWWTPDELASFSGNLWELDAVEVVARPKPPTRQPALPAIESAVFADEGVDVAEFRAWLRERGLALIVSRDVTQRDRSDRQQPFNLRVPGGVQSIGTPGTVYDVAHLQVFQADALRGYGGVDAPQPGRRVLARAMHAEGVSPPQGGPAGSVAVSPDGSVAAIVPAGRALAWQLVDGVGTPVVRERNWVSLQSGEVRVCANCHGINTASQTGDTEPTNEPAALHALLRSWKSGSGGGGGGGGGGGSACSSGIALERPVLRVVASPFKLVLSGQAPLSPAAGGGSPASSGLRVVVDGVLDATIPGGAGWTSAVTGNRWKFVDATGAHDGVRQVVVRDLGGGRLSVSLRANAAARPLPGPAAMQASVFLGASPACTAAAWNGPGAARPRCDGDTSRTACR